MQRSNLFAGLICLFALAAAVRTEAAQIIIQDAFNGTPSANITGRAPLPVNVPGTTWTSGGNGGSIGAGGNNLQLNGDGAGWINIASAGSYTKPGLFVISADLNLAGTAGATLTAGPSNTPSYGDGTSVFGIDLGFKTTEAMFNYRPQAGEPGIVYTSSTSSPGTGELLLISGTTIVQDLGSTGFSTTGTYNLSYLVNTGTGSISDVTFNGTPLAVAATPGLFSDAATTFAGFYQRPNSTDGTAGFADNFTLTAVPEPGTLVLAGTALVGLTLVSLRRRAVR